MVRPASAREMKTVSINVRSMGVKAGRNIGCQDQHLVIELDMEVDDIYKAAESMLEALTNKQVDEFLRGKFGNVL